MPWWPNPNGGAPIQAPTNPNPAGGSYGYYSDPGYSGPPPGGGGGGANAGGGAAGGGTGGNANPSGGMNLAGLNALGSAVSGVTQQQLAQQKAEFDAQLQFAKDQMTQLGIPQLQINQFLAQLQQQQFQSQLALAAQAQQYNQAATTAGLTGWYTPPSGVPDVSQWTRPGALSLGGAGGGSAAGGTAAGGVGLTPQQLQLLQQNPSLANPDYQKTLMSSRGWIFQPGEDPGLGAAAAKGWNAANGTFDPSKVQVAGATGGGVAAAGGGAGGTLPPDVLALLQQNPSLANPAYQQVLQQSRGWVFSPGEDPSLAATAARGWNPTSNTFDASIFTPTTATGGAGGTTGTGPVQTLAGQLQQAQLSGMYQGAPTETAREFNQQLGLQQGQLGQQYLATAAQLQGPQNTFQLSNYLRGAQGNQAVPTYLQSLANNLGMPAFQATGSTPPNTQTAAGLAGQLGGTTSATPGWDYNSTLGAIQGIMGQGAQSLGPGALERLTPDELSALGSGIGAAGGSLPSFLQQYQQSRVGQQASGTPALA